MDTNYDLLRLLTPHCGQESCSARWCREAQANWREYLDIPSDALQDNQRNPQIYGASSWSQNIAINFPQIGSLDSPNQNTASNFPEIYSSCYSNQGTTSYLDNQQGFENRGVSEVDHEVKSKKDPEEEENFIKPEEDNYLGFGSTNIKHEDRNEEYERIIQETDSEIANEDSYIKPETKELITWDSKRQQMDSQGNTGSASGGLQMEL